MKNKNTQWSLPFRYVVGIILFLAFIAFLFYAHEAIKALVIAGFVAYLINPAVMLLMRNTKLSRAAAVNIVYFSALVILIGIPAILTPIFFDEIKIVIRDLVNLVKESTYILSHPVYFGGMVFHFEQLGESLSNMQATVLAPLPQEALALLESTSISVLWVLVIVVSIHLFMTEWPRMSSWIIELAPPDHRDDIHELYQRVRNVWVAYLRGQIVLMFAVGIVFTIAWIIIGIPGALVLGVLAGLFTLIPDVGPFLAVSIAVGVALLEGSTWIPLSNFWVAGITVLAYLVLINLKNFFLRPIIMGRSLQMNEAVIFIAIVMATILEGIMGALLVLPLLASFLVIFEYLRRRVLGLPSFEDDNSQQFIASPTQVRSRNRKLVQRKQKKDS